ncbi:MAG TPA: DUF2752 domain-containing protein [Pyrinomonadaceae bacterium]|nr:DUF2752 domain-containing protein [Pyrinomonadaceae bacterium]
MQLNETARRRLTALFIWLSIAAASTYLLIFEPGKTGFFPSCPFRMLTGFTCPGCGSTRGLHRLLHGDVVAAFQFNPLMVLALPFMLYALSRYTLAAIRGKSLQKHYLPPRYIWMLVGVIMAFWFFRNTRFYPFPPI